MEKLWAGVGLLAMGVVCAALCGCGGRAIRTDVTMSRPPMRLGEAEGRTLVVMQAPHAGWRLDFVRSEKAPGGIKQILLNVRRPDPAFFYPQVVVEQRVITDVDAGTDVEVFARIIDYDAKEPSTPFDRVVLAPWE